MVAKVQPVTTQEHESKGSHVTWATQITPIQVVRTLEPCATNAEVCAPDPSRLFQNTKMLGSRSGYLR